MVSGDRLPRKQTRALVALPSPPQMDISVVSVQVGLLTESTRAGSTGKLLVVLYRVSHLVALLGECLGAVRIRADIWLDDSLVLGLGLAHGLGLGERST